MADQPAAALVHLADRAHFTGRDDLVFCSAVGGYLDPSANVRSTVMPWATWPVTA